jgi:hypothetical protein
MVEKVNGFVGVNEPAIASLVMIANARLLMSYIITKPLKIKNAKFKYFLTTLLLIEGAIMAKYRQQLYLFNLP